MVYALLLLATMLYGGNLVAFRVAAPLMPPVVLAALRCLISFLVLAAFQPFLPTRPRPIRAADVRDFTILGFTGMVFVSLAMFLGMRTTTATNASIIYTSTPAIVAIGSVLFLGETMTWLTTSGILLSLLGVLVILTNGSLQTLQSMRFNRGDLLIFAASLSWAAYLVYGRRVLRRFDPWRATCYATAVGSLVLSIAASFAAPLQALASSTLIAWGLILYLSIPGLGVPFLISNYALQQIGAARTAIFQNMIPIFAMLFGWLLLNERIGAPQIAGAVLVILGVLLVTRRRLALRS